ncbi:MAG: hypothetical protein JWM37_594 [Candidatus Saccharibacteria bacterium]|nr:hypothetical protein [Candidatus Saccharibacteria bacterium]
MRVFTTYMGQGIISITNKTKTMVKTKKARVSLFILSAVLTFGIVGVPVVQGDRFDDAMNALNAQNSANQASINSLANQASDYQTTINQLNNEIYAVQAALAASQAQQADIEQKITVNEAKIAQNKQILGDDLKKGYVEGQISTVEMLATSHDLSDYVDKQEYRATVQTKLQGILTEIQELEIQLKKQHDEVKVLIANQETQRNQLASARAQQAELLAYNQQQQDNFTAQVKSNNAQIAKLRAAQAAENARLSGGTPGVGVNCGGGYPGSAPGPYGNWGCNYALDNTIDKWGMYNRECVSYTAFRVAASGRTMPYWGGRGNAYQWDDNARNSKPAIPVDSSPRVGDVAVKNAGTYGHVMYVEAVYDDGSIYVSDYNQQYDGRYRAYTVSAANVRANSLVFIHF